MTTKISLIVGITVAALAFGVSSGLGERGLAGSNAATPKAVPYTPGPVVKGARAPHSTAAARGASAAGTSTRHADKSGVEPTSPIVVSETHAGTNLEWPQFGAGLGLGLLLAVGSFLAVRMTRARRLFH